MTIRPESGPTPGGAPTGTTRCGGCGTVGYQSDKYCPCCGLPMMLTCSRCGTVIHHPIAYFCTECGSMLNESASDDGQ